MILIAGSSLTLPPLPARCAPRRRFEMLAPLTTSAPLARVHAALRAVLPPRVADRPPSPEIARAAAVMAEGALIDVARVDVKQNFFDFQIDNVVHHS